MQGPRGVGKLIVQSSRGGMCPRSSFWCRGTSECTLVPAFCYRGTSECTLVPVFGTGEHPPKPPIWRPPFSGPPKLECQTPLSANSGRPLPSHPTPPRLRPTFLVLPTKVGDRPKTVSKSTVQTPNSLSCLALTEFRRKSSVSSSGSMIVRKSDSQSFSQNSLCLPKNSLSFSLPIQFSRN